MLNKLPNGNTVNLSKAVTIQAAEASEQFPNIKPRVIIKWFHESSLGRHDSFHECQIVNCDTFEQACQERDRLIDIANRQSSKTVLVSDRYYRASDILSVTKCGWDGSKWYIVAHIKNASKDGSNPVIINCESERQGNELAREIMEQVAGVTE